MSDYRESSNRAKAVRAGIVDARPARGQSKRPTPVVLYGFTKFNWMKDSGSWGKVGKYRDEATARTTAANMARKYRFYLRFRIGAGPEFDPREALKSTLTRVAVP